MQPSICARRAERARGDGARDYCERAARVHGVLATVAAWPCFFLRVVVCRGRCRGACDGVCRVRAVYHV